MSDESWSPKPDILLNGTRDYFRMSEVGTCDLVIGHRILGTQERRRYDGVIAMNMGKAMEPVINDWLIRNGMELAFHGADQLEVAAQDPFRIGHPDGVGYAPGGLGQPLISVLSNESVDLLVNHAPVLVEIKTMNDATWKRFAQYGVESNAMTAHYPDQIMEYVGAMRDPTNDELWYEPTQRFDRDGNALAIPIRVPGAKLFKEWLRERNLDRPEHGFLVGFNTSNKRFATQLFPYDAERYERNSARLERIAETLHSGDLPAPSLDGTSPDCYFCPFSYLCPAVDANRKAAFVGDGAELDLTAPTDLADAAHIDELAAEYLELTVTEKIADARKKEIREELSNRLEVGVPAYAFDHKVKVSQVRGREVIDEGALQEIADSLGFVIPKRRLASGTRLYINRMTGSQMKDGE